MPMFNVAKLFRSEKARVKPILMKDVVAATAPNPEIEAEREILGLRLMQQIVKAAEISGHIRQSVTQQAANQLQGKVE